LIFITNIRALDPKSSSKVYLKHNTKWTLIDLALCFKRTFDDFRPEALIFIMKIKLFEYLAVFLIVFSRKFPGGGQVGYLWLSGAICGYLWISWDIYGYLVRSRLSGPICGYIWLSGAICGYLLLSGAIWNYLWLSGAI
jgi:hypothetical protein